MFPLAWWLLASFKPYTAIFNTTPVYVGFAPTTTNYEVTLLGRSRVEADTGVGGTAGGGSSYYSIPSIRDSLIVAVGATALTLVLATLAAYGLSRFRFSGQQHVLFFVLAQRMMPPIAVAIPIFFMFRDLGLRDTHLGLILAHTLINLPLAVLLMKSFFDDVPQELDEAAMIDGAGAVPMLRARRAAAGQGRPRGHGGAVLHLLLDRVPAVAAAHHQHPHDPGQDLDLRHLDRHRMGLHHGTGQRRDPAQLPLHPARAEASRPRPDLGLAQGLTA